MCLQFRDILIKNGLPPRREEWQWASNEVGTLSLVEPARPSLPAASLGTGLESFKSGIVEITQHHNSDVLCCAKERCGDLVAARGAAAAPDYF